MGERTGLRDEAVKAVAEVFWGSLYGNLNAPGLAEELVAREALQAALPAIEADIRDRLLGDGVVDPALLEEALDRAGIAIGEKP